jgi:hypothetical protein
MKQFLYRRIAEPVQVLLIIPFVRVGATLVGVPAEPLSISAGFELISYGAALEGN